MSLPGNQPPKRSFKEKLIAVAPKAREIPQLVICSTLASLLLTSAGVVMSAMAAKAQIVPDATLGNEGSTVISGAIIQDDIADLIDGGAKRDSNLFHSFSEFNVNAGQRVYFANPDDVESILSRVTGNDGSDIFGTLGVDGPADLFFVNPNGIIFGEQAVLDVEGSFYVTTEEAISLGNGVYSATAPDTSQLLTVSPSVLVGQYLTRNSGDITSRGQLAAQENLAMVANTLDLQGQMAAGDDLTLLAENVKIRDTATDPFVGFAGDELRVQGREQVDILALSHRDSGLYSYGNMVLQSANPVGGDAHYWSGGDFRVEALDGALGSLESPVDPIIRTLGDVEIDGYRGSSLHILAGGSVKIGTAIITEPDAGALGVDFLRETITLLDDTVVQVDGGAQPTLDIRAGVKPEALGEPPLSLLTGFDNNTFDLLPVPISETNIPSGANIEIGDVALWAANGLVLLTNHYQPNETLTGNILITGDGLFDLGIFADRIRGALNSQVENAYFDSRNNVTVTNALIATSGIGDVGDIVINAEGLVRFEGAVVATNLSNEQGQGGDIRIRAESVEVLDGTDVSASISGPGNVGGVMITAQDRVVFNDSNISSRSVSAGTGDSGNIVLKARTVEVLNDTRLRTSTFRAGNAGDVVIMAQDRVVFNDSNISSRSFSTTNGDGGAIEITARSLDVLNGSRLETDANGSGNAGSIVIDVRDGVRFEDSSGSSRVFGSSQGRGGNITITARTLEILNRAFLTASTSGTQDAGNIVITTETLDVLNAGLTTATSGAGDAGDIVIMAQDGVVLNDSEASSRVQRDGDGNGGDIVITAGALDVINGARLDADTEDAGDAGDIMINVRGRVRFEGTSADGVFGSGATSGVLNPFTDGNGGDIVITTGTLEVLNGASLATGTFGLGNAGKVVITTRDRILIQGNAGINTRSDKLSSTGEGNDIRIVAPLLILKEAALLADTNNSQPGGDIILTLGRLEILDGGQIISSSQGSGVAGNLRIDATQGVLVAGRNPNFSNLVAADPELAEVLSAQSILSVRSTANGTAGNIIIGTAGTTPEIFLNDSGQIIAESASTDGGNIFITLNDLLLLRNQGLISTTAGTAQASGNGGNITINSPFIVAIPNENSDIAADAFEGTGGNVNITARGVFGIQPRPQRTPLSDITASSELGINGTVNLATLNTDTLENSLTELDDTLIDPTTITASSCIAAGATDDQSSLIITGRDNLPAGPDDVSLTNYSTETVQLVTSTPSISLQEPNALYQLTDGRLVLGRQC
ncbi:filamentous hemagglutinin N-terminal domain-containing protein [Adonisia turfae]|uniref:Filamentous hemagglutinin N-terminal domain-containing protein n=1 Tax=Adonisia turfae CCMR0081 TaxID=2292702 RepID=A0A6M0RJ55_9CYAN|nr:filamentous hemagglutinin N-terminal domain-containing protein [Adonisia turfae]NEZ56265.1 filamentous hemagglutinin N-terminal domain-containing protein [Adonisia turfae CCMR0081]